MRDNREEKTEKKSGFSLIKAAVNTAAVCFCLQIGFAVFGLPYSLSAWLRCEKVPKVEHPQWIIVLGASGVPSSATLQRAYYGAQCALAHPQARCIVALPCPTDPEKGVTARFRDELVIRGVKRKRISMEFRGHNTHQQAVNTARMVGPAGRRSPVIIVTSPYHMRRAYLAFRKAGFEQPSCLPAGSTSSEDDYRRAVESWSGFYDFRGFIMHFRYAFWSNLTAQIWMTRELIGIAIYKIRGWG